MNKFRGELKKVDINKVYPNDWNPKQKLEENHFNQQKYQKIKKNIELKALYAPILTRTYKDGWQIIDGYHRWLACKELGYKQIMIWDLGKVSDEEAKTITLDSIYLKIDPFEPLTAKIISELSKEIDIQKLIEITPFNEKEIEEYLQIDNFDWDFYKKNTEEKIKEKKKIVCPNCGTEFEI